ncbi:MAG TPA: hypothetical protein VK701_06280 [Solirubrobacteraceae bacterium]|nr:hypothetical protein [Solirubrobacteraceae bacterium]
MARVLIVEGASRGIRLAGALVAEGHAVRVVSNDPERREAIDGAGAECFLGTPERLATLRGALEHVAIACWLLADIGGDGNLARALHGPRLERFLGDAIDSTLRGFLYEAGGKSVPAEVLARGERIVSETGHLNSIPVAVLSTDPLDCDEWLAQALGTIQSLLEGRQTGALS